MSEEVFSERIGGWVGGQSEKAQLDCGKAISYISTPSGKACLHIGFEAFVPQLKLTDVYKRFLSSFFSTRIHIRFKISLF